MLNSNSESYKSAGVDITSGYEAVRLIKDDVEKTHISGVLSGIGGFGGLFMPDLSGIKEPVLVSGTDGVGTKLKLAFILDKNDTIGIDCVAMCVNDIICSGAKPLYFLDYIAIGKNRPEKIREIVSGVSNGCLQAGCALIGGETAEMPGMYKTDEYDLAGFSTGIVSREKIIDGSTVAAGDLIIGLSSTGVHSNGFSLVRKVLRIDSEATLAQTVPEDGRTLGDILLTPTAIYVKPILSLIEKINVKAISHITGGGFYENIPRCLPENLAVQISKDSYKIPSIFKLLKDVGNIPEKDMYNTFNMGIGMTVIVPKESADNAVKLLSDFSVTAYCIGEVIENTGNRVVII